MTHYEGGFEEAYPKIIGAILCDGKKVTPRAGSSLGETLELCPFDFSIPGNMPLCRLKSRKLALLFVFLEPLYLFTDQERTRIADALMTYAPNLKKLALNEDTGRFDGNYGDRIHLAGPLPLHGGGVSRSDYGLGDQMLRVYRLLAKDPHSRRAIVTIHNPVWDIVDGDSKDIPCTLSLHFMIREGVLDCYCTMRSNDVWYGTPHNVFMFTFLQRALASWLSVGVGTYHHRANSFHLYTSMLDKAEKFVDDSTANPKYWDLEDAPAIINYPYGCKSIFDTETDANAVMRRELMYRENQEMPELYPLTGEYMTIMFDLLEGFWSRKRAKEGRDISGEIRHNKDTPSTNDLTAHTS